MSDPQKPIAMAIAPLAPAQPMPGWRFRWPTPPPGSRPELAAGEGGRFVDEWGQEHRPTAPRGVRR